MLSQTPAATLLRLPPPPHNLAGNASLFLDFDGTLTPIVDRPDAVVVDDALRGLLDRLVDRFPQRVAILSGRSLAQVEHFLGPVAERLFVAGSHGAELRAPHAARPPAPTPPGLDAAIADMTRFGAGRRGVMVEVKTVGVALHYRLAPDQEGAAHAMAAELAAEHGLVVQHGKMVVELRAPGDKGRAVAAILSTTEMAGTRPLAFGDDLTDEDAFAAAAALGGAGVLVGEPRATAAAYGLPDPAAVIGWLERALEGPVSGEAA